MENIRQRLEAHRRGEATILSPDGRGDSLVAGWRGDSLVAGWRSDFLVAHWERRLSCRRLEGRLSCRPLGQATFLSPAGGATFLSPTGTGDFLVAASALRKKNEEGGLIVPPTPPNRRQESRRSHAVARGDGAGPGVSPWISEQVPLGRRGQDVRIVVPDAVHLGADGALLVGAGVRLPNQVEELGHRR